MKQVLTSLLAMLAVCGLVGVALLAVTVLALPLVCCDDLPPQYLGTLTVHAQCETAEPIALWIYDCDATGDDTQWAEVQPGGSVSVRLPQSNYAVFVPGSDVSPYFVQVLDGEDTEVIYDGAAFVPIPPATGCLFPEHSWPEEIPTYD